MKQMSSLQFLEILRRTLNRVDSRLVNHGDKVGYLIYSILTFMRTYSKDEIAEITLLGILHDIGAYKTEEIDDMMEFENSHVWYHSIYGYLFLKNLSKMREKAIPLLYHHLPYKYYEEVGLKEDDIAGLIRLADRIDVITSFNNPEFCEQWIQDNKGTMLSPYWVRVFFSMPNYKELLVQIASKNYTEYSKCMAEDLEYEYDEIENYLTVIAYAIDFRSEFMVLHTVTTVNVSLAIGERMNLSPKELNDLYFGSLLHDVGKISCPVEILEKPGKLTSEEMEIMKDHVVDTRRILEGLINNNILEIAARHHERIDGSGYPDHLKFNDLTRQQRICAVADIVSALVRQRSYKDAFGKEKTIGILSDMDRQGLLDSQVVEVVINDFDQIMDEVNAYGKEVIEAYEAIQSEYQLLIDKYNHLDM